MVNIERPIRNEVLNGVKDYLKWFSHTQQNIDAYHKIAEKEEYKNRNSALISDKEKKRLKTALAEEQEQFLVSCSNELLHWVKGALVDEHHFTDKILGDIFMQNNDSSLFCFDLKSGDELNRLGSVNRSSLECTIDIYYIITSGEPNQFLMISRKNLQRAVRDGIVKYIDGKYIGYKDGYENLLKHKVEYNVFFCKDGKEL